MRKTAANMGLILLIILVDVYFVITVAGVSRYYPFSRIITGNELTYATGIIGRDDDFGARLISLHGMAIEGKDLMKMLAGLPSGETIEAIFEGGGQKAFTVGAYNRNYIWFFIVLLLMANIHFAYGIMVRLFRWNSYQSRLFFSISMAQGAFFFLLVDMLTLGRGRFLVPLAAGALAYFVVLAGYNIARERLSRGAAAAFTALTAGFFSIFLYCANSSRERGAFIALFSYIIACGLIASVKLIRGILAGGNAYSYKSQGLALAAFTLSGMVAPAFFIAGLFIDLPVHYAAAFTLSLPLLIGNSLFQYNLFSSRLFFIKGMSLLLLNLVTAVIAGGLIYCMSISVKTPGELALFYFAISAVFAGLLYGERTARRKLGNVLLVDRDNFSRSLQNIENLVATHEDVTFKIERIYTEISLITGVSETQLVLFDGSYELNNALEGGLVEMMSPDSDLVQYFKNERGPLFNYSLIKRSPLEERITRFLDKRGVLLVSPVFSQDGVIGALLLGPKQNGELFNGIDLHYIETVSLQIRQMLENDRLLKNYITRRRFEMELDIASYIQSRLFPRSAPDSSRMAISFYNRPFLKVTGDYFDFIEIDRKSTAIIIGDISGHGLAAAMILSMTSSTIHSLLREKAPIENVIEEVNYFLNNRYRGTELITLFAGIYNNATRELTYINAGHCPPALLKGGEGEIQRLEGRSKILGADPSASYFASKITFNKGDELFLFTDGALEIYDEKTGREFTEKDLLDTIRGQAGSDIEGKINALIDRINSFGDSLRDDITLIAVKFN